MGGLCIYVRLVNLISFQSSLQEADEIVSDLQTTRWISGSQTETLLILSKSSLDNQI